MLQYVAVCCSVLQCVTVSDSSDDDLEHDLYGGQICVAVFCTVLQYVAVCCSVLQFVAVSDSSNDDLEHNMHGTQIIPIQFLHVLDLFYSLLNVRTQQVARTHTTCCSE